MVPTWRDAERLIYEEIKRHPKIDPQGLADHIADMLLTFDLLAVPDDDGTAEPPSDAHELLTRIEKLCDQPMNHGTPWWVFRDAVREILKDEA